MGTIFIVLTIGRINKTIYIACCVQSRCSVGDQTRPMFSPAQSDVSRTMSSDTTMKSDLMEKIPITPELSIHVCRRCGGVVYVRATGVEKAACERDQKSHDRKEVEIAEP
ncbi:hypothetical protein PHET_04439 [Paragonimus heterotremus]|uniref:Uncharacterized protein n=1 Tax=Paragonimus heterotremus TaxID=100268 RepID=A0A8J4X0H4_9TREM|nr:hypothetical protein PHET_04439 [Paragonimus heterotremus]